MEVIALHVVAVTVVEGSPPTVIDGHRGRGRLGVAGTLSDAPVTVPLLARTSKVYPVPLSRFDTVWLVFLAILCHDLPLQLIGGVTSETYRY